MMTFQDMGLKKEVLSALSEMGFEQPTSIQAKAIPQIIASKQDLIGRAQTGTGKTGAFGIPILNNLDLKSDHVQALILCPTRELCLQITREMQNFAKDLPSVKVIPVYGGSSMDTQVFALKNKCQIVVATPGRALDLVNRKKLKLDQLQWLVLDEADEMLSMGFKDDMDAILATTPPEKQTLLFSATLPKEIMRIVKTYMNEPVEIAAEKVQTGADNVTHHYYEVQAKDRYVAIKRILDVHPDIYAIVFCRTRAETKEIAEKLSADGYNSDALHGDLSQQQREYTMGRFRSKTLQLLIATDVAARGLDVNDLTHVINYNLPDDPDVYIHRSGRTGRAHRKGVSITIIHSREHNRLRELERRIGKPFEKKLVPTGKEICEKQLYHLVDKVENVEVDENQIKDYLPVIFNKLAWLDRDELIKRFMSIEFNQFLSYYKDSRDINLDSKNRSDDRGRGDRGSRDDRGSRGSGDRRQETGSREPWKKKEYGPRDDQAQGNRRQETGDREPWKKKEYGSRDDKAPRAERSPRSDRDDSTKSERPRRDDRGYGDKPAPAKRGEERPKGKFASLVINAGTVNKFNPKTLLTLINQYLPDQEAQIGKIDIQFSHTVFDVDENYQDQVINAFKKAKYKGTTLIVDKLKGKKKSE
ncbi:MAG: DEAD/DEAH box helicase [Saprospiraceae bacterium]|nr:DEAD/DEAH box helicase [Saprospiraceae bacterium]